MRSTYLRLLSALLCLVLLCGCAAENHADGTDGSSNTPPAENTSPDTDIPPEAPDESGGASADEEELPFTELTAEELQEWEDYFNAMEHNGLLRFPYADPAGDPDQLAPYLHWLFYDIGESESTFTEEELALLDEADFWLELDAFRLSRDFMNAYLFDHFSISAEKTENLLDAANVGLYLMEYDAWYISHGDTAYNRYTMDHGTVFENGTVRLYYTNDFLSIVQDSGEMEYIDAPMVITLVPREDGSWCIVSHEIENNPYS